MAEDLDATLPENLYVWVELQMPKCDGNPGLRCFVTKFQFAGNNVDLGIGP